MFFTLSKLIYWLVMPTSLFSFLFIGALLARSNRIRKKLLGTGVVLLMLFTNPMIGKWVMNQWEPAAIPYSEINQTYDYGVVLTGITNIERAPYDRIQFNKGADRIVQAIELYKRGIIRNIFITGGSGGLSYNVKNESQSLREFAVSCGVASQHIIVETEARNTRENAIFSHKKLSSFGPTKILLITSAFHVPRAKLCFEKIGLMTDSFPTDHYGDSIHLSLDRTIVPSVDALKTWHILFKEWLGIIVYWMVDYI